MDTNYFIKNIKARNISHGTSMVPHFSRDIPAFKFVLEIPFVFHFSFFKIGNLEARVRTHYSLMRSKLQVTDFTKNIMKRTVVRKMKLWVIVWTSLNIWVPWEKYETNQPGTMVYPYKQVSNSNKNSQNQFRFKGHDKCPKSWPILYSLRSKDSLYFYFRKQQNKINNQAKWQGIEQNKVPNWANSN